jgi:hypothetical protein
VDESRALKRPNARRVSTSLRCPTHAKFFAEQVITKPTQREIALRFLYIICSFIAIAVDFSLKEFSFLEQTEKSVMMRDGFTYGSKGSSGMKKVLNLTRLF